MDDFLRSENADDGVEREKTNAIECYAVPQKLAGKRFIIAYALAYFGLWVALLTPGVVSLAVKVQQVALQTPARSLSVKRLKPSPLSYTRC